jgi:hypothetical protein
MCTGGSEVDLDVGLQKIGAAIGQPVDGRMVARFCPRLRRRARVQATKCSDGYEVAPSQGLGYDSLMRQSWPVGSLRRRWRRRGRRLRGVAYGLSAVPLTAFIVYRLAAGLAAAKAVGRLVADSVGFGLVSMLLLLWWFFALSGWGIGLWRRNHSDLALSFDPDEQLLRLKSRELDESIALEQVEQANAFAIDDREKRSCLRLTLKDGRELELEMASQDAEAFLQRAQLGPRHRAYRLQAHRVGFGAVGLLGYFMLIPASFLGVVASSLGPASLDYWFQLPKETWAFRIVLALVTTLVIGAIWDSLRWLLAKVVGHEVELGNDGIRWGGFFSPRFVAYSEVASIRFEGTASRARQDWLVLLTHSGEVFRIGLRGTGEGSAKALAARLREALDQEADLLVPELEQRERSDTAWRSELRELLRGDGHYRQSRMSREKVRELLHDPSALAEQRLGAAVALLETEEPELQDQLLRICDGTANPQLKQRFAELAHEAERLAEHEAELDANTTPRASLGS